MSSIIDRRRGRLDAKAVPRFQGSNWALWVRRRGEGQWQKFGTRRMAESEVQTNILRASAQDPSQELGYGPADAAGPLKMWTGERWVSSNIPLPNRNWTDVPTTTKPVPRFPSAAKANVKLWTLWVLEPVVVEGNITSRQWRKFGSRRMAETTVRANVEESAVPGKAYAYGEGVPQLMYSIDNGWSPLPRNPEGTAASAPNRTPVLRRPTKQA